MKRKRITLQDAKKSWLFGVFPSESKHWGWVEFGSHFEEEDPQTHFDFKEVEHILSVTLGEPQASCRPHLHFPELHVSAFPSQIWFPPQVQTPKLQRSEAPEQGGAPPHVQLPFMQTSVTFVIQSMPKHESSTFNVGNENYAQKMKHQIFFLFSL